MSNEQLAREIVDSVGGKNNLTFLENCMTRVRIDVRNPEAVDVERLKMLDGIMGVVCENDNIQLVVGTGKCVKIVKAIEDLTGFKQGFPPRLQSASGRMTPRMRPLSSCC